MPDEKDRDARRARLDNKITEVTEYFTKLRRAGRLEQSQLELWLRQLHRKISKPVKPKGDEIIYKQNVETGEKLQDELAECFREAVEQRHVEQRLLRLKTSLFSQFGFDLGENDEEETGEWIP